MRSSHTQKCVVQGVFCLLLFGLVLTSAPAHAVDFKISGIWQIGFEHSNVLPRHGRHTQNDNFGAMQRFRTQLEVISDRVSGAIQLEMGRTEWGKADKGGALGADGTDVKVRFAYIDWLFPHTDVKIRMGLQMLMLPGVLSQWGVGPIYGKEQAGITISSPIYHGDNFNLDATFFWGRPYNDNSIEVAAYANRKDNRLLDNLDVFGLVLPFQGDGFKITPYGMYALIGQYSLTGVNAQIGDSGVVAPRGGLMPVLGSGNPYTYFQNNYTKSLDKAWGEGFWAGLVGDINLTSNLRLGFEGAYGSVDMGSVKNYAGFNDGKNRTLDVRRHGWYVGARLDYKADFGVPGLLVWYGSGDDDDPYNGSERLPQFNTPWGVSSLGFGGGVWDEFTWKVLGHNPSGMAAVIAQIDRLSFVDDLYHTLRFGYYIGTNSPEMVRKANMTWPTRADGAQAYLTSTDNAWELNLVSTYKIYENLSVSLDAAYVRVNLDSDTWKGAEDALWENNYRVGASFTYQF